MKTIGLIGGMNWKSSALYYQIINERIERDLGGLHSGKILLYSYDFDEMVRLQNGELWTEWENNLCEKALMLQKAGAELIVMCCNTAHKAAESIERRISVPLIHIADAVGAKIKQAQLSKVGLLGTVYTMEEDFYKNRLASRFDLSVIVPEKTDRERIHRIIFDELELGIISKKSKKMVLKAIQRLIEGGAQGIILGCTEISALIRQKDVRVPVFDTISIHAGYACERAQE
jgi:amino-acid racemase